MRFVTTAEVDWSDAESVIEYLVGYQRVLAGGRRPFDETAARELVRRDIERARNFAAAQNHDAIEDDGRLAQAPLLDHRADAGDPRDRRSDVPARARQGARRRDPAARLLTLDGAGHGVDRADWETIVRAIVEHTAGSQVRV